MSVGEFTKLEKKELRRLSGVAYERELSSASGELESEFGRWRKGVIDVFLLNELIHQFHDVTSRDLYKAYVMGDTHWNVASAIARGILKESEVKTSVLDKLRSAIDMAREFSQLKENLDKE